MAPPDGQSESSAHLVAAAQAAASWVRARRSAWTDTPLPIPPRSVAQPPRAVEPAPPVQEPPPPPLVTPPPPAIESPRPVVVPPRFVEREDDVQPPPFEEPPRIVEPPHAAEPPTHMFERAPTIGSPAADSPSIGRWVGIAAAGIAIVAAGAFGVPYLWRALPPSSQPKPAPEAQPATQVAPAGASRPGTGRRSASGPAAAPAGSASAPPPEAGATGDVRVTSTPPGARVLLDGKLRGVTPVTLTGVATGTHEVTVTSDAGSVRRSVRVDAGEPAEVDESIFPGWVAVLAPFDVEISENGRALRADDRGQILLPPGMHDLRLTNGSLSYASVQHVEVKPGATTPVRVAAPSSTLTVTSAESAEVWLDGARIGSTPLNAHPVALGTHEVLVKRPGGDRRFTVIVGTSPITLNADTQR